MNDSSAIDQMTTVTGDPAGERIARLEAECARLTESFRVLALQTGELRSGLPFLRPRVTCKSVNDYCMKVLAGMPVDPRWPIKKGGQ